MKLGTAKPRMTRGRAVLIGLLDRYLGLADLGALPVEIHKLMYFAQRAGEPLRLRFVPGRYGPYAEALSHVLEAMEGHYVRGQGDRSMKVSEAEPITLVDGAADEARAWLGARPESADRIDRVLELADGFQSAYEMELLATVDWVANGPDQAAKSDSRVAFYHVQHWNERKKRLFTERHVALAWRRLSELGWSETPVVADWPAQRG
ncbi:MAG: hypothetical protein ACP5VR_04385 [Acidimicrobiales bacterium]